MSKTPFRFSILAVLLTLGQLAVPLPAGVPSDETWTLTQSPIVLTNDTTIGPGATVTIEPGVVVELQQGAKLFVEGSLVGAGTPSAPITFTGDVSFVYIAVSGSLVLSNAVIDVQVWPKGQGSLEFADTTFDSSSRLVNNGSGYLLTLDRCTFNGAWIWLGGGTVRLRDIGTAGGSHCESM